MKALCWHGKGDMRYETVPDPKIQDPRDAIIKVTACAICGSDLHIYDGVIPQMEKGDVIGHETMGEVVEVGAANTKLKVGDRVVVPFTISCGECFFCKRGYYSGCERSNPDAAKAAKLWGHAPAGLFGYSHLLGGYPGGQAEYLRVPFADVGPIKVPNGLSDDQSRASIDGTAVSRAPSYHFHIRPFLAAPESFLPSALTAFGKHVSRLHFLMKLLSAEPCVSAATQH